MGIVLPFHPRGTRGHMDPVVIRCDDGTMSTNPMRRIVERACMACGFVYIQPATTGACPQCHGVEVVNVDLRACAAPYRK